jgi:hypothetical protein
MQQYRWPGICLLLGLAASSPVYATLTFNATFDTSITTDPNAASIEGAINSALAIYSADFSDPITVAINFQEMATGLGQSNTALYKLNYNTFYNALVADATTANDATALAHLPNGAPVGSTNPVTGSTTINVKTAEIRALGIAGSFPSGLPGGVDGVIGLNTHITDIGSPGTSGLYSLTVVVEHEVDEVLGLGSDDSGTGFFADPAPEDLYRYSSTAGVRSYTTSTSAKAYFSIDGSTDLAQFDNQGDGGDWGDWQSNPLPGGVQPEVQDAFATAGAHPALGVELTALDVIGYGLATTTPEPGTFFVVGAGLLGAFLLKRRARA